MDLARKSIEGLAGTLSGLREHGQEQRIVRRELVKRFGDVALIAGLGDRAEAQKGGAAATTPSDNRT